MSTEISSYAKAVEAIVVAGGVFPQLRVGQLLKNATSGKNLYYVTDEELATALYTYIEEHGDR